MPSAATTLPASAGYGVVVGVGFFFAFVMMFISYLQNRYTRFSTKQSEEFNTASRSVKPGLIASGIVSAWTWAATLLQSSSVAYTYGVAGPFWYAAGATVQILIFSVLACKVKQNSPRCHTFLEIIYTRYGAVAHVIFIFFALVTNILVGSQLLLGGSAVMASLTGANVYAAIFLIPAGVCLYVVLGGLRATFLCDYSHTLILMIIILFFMFHAYATSDLIGSPSKMYDLLVAAGEKMPVEGNKDGSYVTIKSNKGLVFGVIQLCAGSGTVFLDQAYWQRAIASRPSTAVRAYIMGGIAWFAIPFGFSTTLGLAAVALTDNPNFPTYPNKPTESDISAGLAAAFSAAALLGKSGAAALLVVLFMAVTSCASAELIAVSSILTFDIYKTYLKPQATPSSLIFVSHVCICIFGLAMAIFACIWDAIGIDLGWLYLVMGLLIGGGVFPCAFAITWRGQTRMGCILGAVVGFAAGIIAWLATAKALYGELTLHTTGLQYPTLAGNLAAIMMGLIVTVVVSLALPDPQPFDWEITRAINNATAAGDSNSPDSATPPQTVAAGGDEPEKSGNDMAKGDQDVAVHSATPLEAAATAPLDDPRSLAGAYKTACIASYTLSFIMVILVPMPMFFSEYVFSKGFFTAWVVISFLWVFTSTFISTVLPVVETLGFFKELAGKMRADLTRR
ncbi:solute symporter family transporter [Phyllosticta citribraziliensis]|uniref:Solute symporter family transporter n=1 Tax=Phyllosticta citribraziliensis TaxID=989973 RepID=A0ABR1L5H2_9PEZI